jgi:tRNA(Ile2) C34 agmatinyltransferase TiaS
MKIRIGKVEAACPDCRGSAFEALTAERRGAGASFRCRACGRTVSYTALVIGVSERVIAESRRILAKLRRERD